MWAKLFGGAGGVDDGGGKASATDEAEAEAEAAAAAALRVKFATVFKQLRGHLVKVNGWLQSKTEAEEEGEEEKGLCSQLQAHLGTLCELLEKENKRASSRSAVGQGLQEVLSSPLLQQLTSVCLTRLSTRLRCVLIKFLLQLLDATGHVLIVHEAPLKAINAAARFCTGSRHTQRLQANGEGRKRQKGQGQGGQSSQGEQGKGHGEQHQQQAQRVPRDPLRLPQLLPEAEAKLLGKLVGRVMAFVGDDASLLNLLFVNTTTPSFHLFNATLCLLEQPGKLRREVHNTITAVCRLSHHHRELQHYLVSSRLAPALAGRVARCLAALPATLRQHRRAWILEGEALPTVAPGAITYLNSLQLCADILPLVPAPLQRKLCLHLRHDVIDTVMLPRIALGASPAAAAAAEPSQKRGAKSKTADGTEQGNGLRREEDVAIPTPQHHKLSSPPCSRQRLRHSAARRCAAATAYADLTLRYCANQQLTALFARSILDGSCGELRVWRLLCRRMEPPHAHSHAGDTNSGEDDDGVDRDLGFARGSDGGGRGDEDEHDHPYSSGGVVGGDGGGAPHQGSTPSARSQLRLTTLALMDTLLSLRLRCVYDRAVLSFLRRQRSHYHHGAECSNADVSDLGAPPSIGTLSTSAMLSCPLQQVFLLEPAVEMKAATALLRLRITSRSNSPNQRRFTAYLQSARESMAAMREWWGKRESAAAPEGGGEGDLRCEDTDGSRVVVRENAEEKDVDAAFVRSLLQAVSGLFHASSHAMHLITGLVRHIAAADEDAVRTFLFEPEREDLVSSRPRFSTAFSTSNRQQRHERLHGDALTPSSATRSSTSTPTPSSAPSVSDGNETITPLQQSPSPPPSPSHTRGPLCGCGCADGEALQTSSTAAAGVCRSCSRCVDRQAPVLLTTALRCVQQEAAAHFAADPLVVREVASFYRGDRRKFYRRKRGPRGRRKRTPSQQQQQQQQHKVSGGGSGLREMLRVEAPHATEQPGRNACKSGSNATTTSSSGGESTLTLSNLQHVRGAGLERSIARPPDDTMSEISVFLGLTSSPAAGGIEGDTSVLDARSSADASCFWDSDSMLEGSISAHAMDATAAFVPSQQQQQQQWQFEGQSGAYGLRSESINRFEQSVYGSGTALPALPESPATTVPSSLGVGSAVSGGAGEDAFHNGKERPGPPLSSSTPAKKATGERHPRASQAAAESTSALATGGSTTTTATATALPASSSSSLSTASTSSVSSPSSSRPSRAQALALRIVLFDEFVKELAAFALEHSIAVVERAVLHPDDTSD